MIDYDGALAALAAAGVRLVIMGVVIVGVAVIIDGSPYVSFDIDDGHVEKIQAAHERSNASTSSRSKLPSATPMYRS